jgi:hypothetical protein
MDLSKVEKFHTLSNDEILKGINSRLRAGVLKRLQSDAEIGYLLSGGLDSSLVCALAQKPHTGKPIRTFSIGMTEDAIDSKYAQDVADFIGANHTNVTMTVADVMNALRDVILKQLPQGFEECINYGMIGYVVPHSIYPAGYHCDPKLPLPFMNIANQKSFIAFYHMGIYANEQLFNWFVAEYPKHCKTKLDMGKSCIRFKKLDDIPFELIAELAGKVSVSDWIKTYETAFKK